MREREKERANITIKCKQTEQKQKNCVGITIIKCSEYDEHKIAFKISKKRVYKNKRTIML